ncbi:hypothetical protein RJT34_16185 [Clitoria ternatea]|uniref:Uncharacterized protein n=1 Tax=Clitoria ternatea TaxID=43366 RepID=A0AAN9J6R0_CLITE
MKQTPDRVGTLTGIGGCIGFVIQKLGFEANPLPGTPQGRALKLHYFEKSQHYKNFIPAPYKLKSMLSEEEEFKAVNALLDNAMPTYYIVDKAQHLLKERIYLTKKHDEAIEGKRVSEGHFTFFEGVKEELVPDDEDDDHFDAYLPSPSVDYA